MSIKKDKTLVCSFCGKNQTEVQKIVSGSSADICNECVNACKEMLEKDQTTSQVIGDEIKVPTPEEINKFLNDYVLTLRTK